MAPYEWVVLDRQTGWCGRLTFGQRYVQDCHLRARQPEVAGREGRAQTPLDVGSSGLESQRYTPSQHRDSSAVSREGVSA